MLNWTAEGDFFGCILYKYQFLKHILKMLHTLGRFLGSARLYCPRESTGAEACYNFAILNREWLLGG